MQLSEDKIAEFLTSGTEENNVGIPKTYCLINVIELVIYFLRSIRKGKYTLVTMQRNRPKI